MRLAARRLLSIPWPPCGAWTTTMLSLRLMLKGFREKKEIPISCLSSVSATSRSNCSSCFAYISWLVGLPRTPCIVCSPKWHSYSVKAWSLLLILPLISYLFCPESKGGLTSTSISCNFKHKFKCQSWFFAISGQRIWWFHLFPSCNLYSLRLRNISRGSNYIVRTCLLVPAQQHNDLIKLSFVVMTCRLL